MESKKIEISNKIERWFAFYGEEFSTLENARKFAYFYGIEELIELFDQLDSKV